MRFRGVGASVPAPTKGSAVALGASRGSSEGAAVAARRVRARTVLRRMPGARSDSRSGGSGGTWGKPCPDRGRGAVTKKAGCPAFSEVRTTRNVHYVKLGSIRIDETSATLRLSVGDRGTYEQQRDRSFRQPHVVHCHPANSASRCGANSNPLRTSSHSSSEMRPASTQRARTPQDDAALGPPVVGSCGFS